MTPVSEWHFYMNQQKVAGEQAVLVAEQEAFKKQQDAAMSRVLENYVDLSDKYVCQNKIFLGVLFKI